MAAITGTGSCRQPHTAACGKFANPWVRADRSRFSPPAIPGIGTSGGVTFLLQDRSGKDVEFLAENVMKFVAAARERKELAGVTPMFSPSVPQAFLNVDREKVLKQNVDLADVYKTLQTFMGGYFVNYFNRFGRQWQVFVQADGDYRKQEQPFHLPSCVDGCYSCLVFPTTMGE